VECMQPMGAIRHATLIRPQVALVIGRYSPTICHDCSRSRRVSPALCEHGQRRTVFGATMSLVDTRQARLTDRFSLLHDGVHPHVATSTAREHYVFTRSAGCTCPGLSGTTEALKADSWTTFCSSSGHAERAHVPVWWSERFPRFVADFLPSL
jgi:hypothetical protein